MQDLYGRYKFYIFLGLGGVVALAAWWGLSGEPAPDSLITTENVSGLSPTEKSLVDTLLQLRAVSLSGTIFADPAFTILRDFGTQIIPEPVGRENPFAPLSPTQPLKQTATSSAPTPKSSSPAKSAPATPTPPPVD